MIEAGAVIPCDLYLRRHDGQPVFYRARDLAFDEERRNRLAESGTDAVWIPFDQAEAWRRYLERGLRERLANTDLPLEQRAAMLVESSRDIMRDVLADPSHASARPRVEELSHAICELVRTPEAVQATVQLLSHDYYTYTHCVHVSIYSVALGRAAGIDDEPLLLSIGRGALMHDCGKCHLPAAVINKNGPLDDAEWELMRQHPEAGAQLLEQSGWRDPLPIEIALSHHERIDGSGYPHGLTGAAVRTPARIAAICDAYDAMTTERAYQRALTGFEALKVLVTKGRDKYDIPLVQQLIAVLGAGG